MDWIAALSIVGRIAAVLLIVLGTGLLLSFLALHRHARVQRRRVEALRAGKRSSSRISPAESSSR